MKQLSDWCWPTLPLTKVAAIRRSLDLDPGSWTPAGDRLSLCALVLWRDAVFFLMVLVGPGPGPGPGLFWLGVVYQYSRTWVGTDCDMWPRRR